LHQNGSEAVYCTKFMRMQALSLPMAVHVT
jgi:hypothetical protein